MAKRISVSFTDYCWRKHLKNYDGDNQSKFIEEMFMEGIEKYDPEQGSLRSKNIELELTINTLKAQNTILKNQIERLKQGTNNQTAKIHNTPGAEEWLEKAKERYKYLLKNPPSECMIKGEGALSAQMFLIQNRKGFNRTFGINIDLEEYKKLIQS